MSTFMISYDLWWPENSSDYKKVSDYIKSLWAWAKPLESFYFVVSWKSTSDIRNELIKITDNNDKIVVLDVSWDDWATSFISKEITDWMNFNI